MPAPAVKSLESWIWDAACSIRGAKDAPKYKDYILPLIFTKRLCDVFDDEIDRIAAKVGSRPKAFQLVKMDWRKAGPGIVKDLKLLKLLFQNKMEEAVPPFLALLQHNFNDKDIDSLIEHFRDPERRKEFFKEYKEIEMLYEIISPDAFLRPFIDDYSTLSAIYDVVRKAYTQRVQVDRDFQRKTNALVQEHVTTYRVNDPLAPVAIDENTIDLIKKKHAGDGTKVINLIKGIEKAAEEQSSDPFLVAMAERARAVQEQFEGRQKTTAEALEDLLREVQRNEERKKEQAGKGFDALTYFVFRTLEDARVENAEAVSQEIRKAFVEHPNWRSSEAALRDLRQQVTFAIVAACDDLEHVTVIVDNLFTILEKAPRS